MEHVPLIMWLEPEHVHLPSTKIWLFGQEVRMDGSGMQVVSDRTLPRGHVFMHLPSYRK